ncbi:retrotransposon hot spot (RHS) protein, putative [Trypanosoma brucei gambiense DAL972]|uniref:Retrotransposon hot spot (RHS) protein, putative n=1 Tax=Trypanosoma brucei gambiense (strain MHOM/CI/86/DAL972) TaxID=679716 RepID=D0A6L8_TRYB9|nr:retrotransposon hot spot (RHS) protein, putative [Trypanosoma brucei gambiense DAL972]CBH17319.1 retrotransposon hot spot (RHS) protein, putative [Trypanosoma brucei gambiense DAL972]|eukprot:XP_011779583.1 retrotransposon hot spot (RHS) protein, putative [Trypanosoma brucei gambiense DAL972]
MNQQVPIEGRGDIEGRRREREEAARNDAEPPAVQQRVENNNQPQWRLFSCIEAVLLNGRAHPENVSVNDFLRRNLLDDIDLDQRLLRASMFAFVQRCEEYINDVNALNRIFATTEYQVYKVFATAYPLLFREGILNLQRWQQADEEVKAGLQVNIRGLRDGERLWIIVTNMLNDALDVALERAAQTAASAVEIKGVYDSIYDAKWSYVMSGYRREPLGMKVFDGKPQRIWTEAEVDINPEPANVDARVPERPYGLEIFVLTSEKGWPYDRFASRDVNIRKNNFKHVYIRREIMRVWYIIQRGLQTWWVEKTARRTPIHIVIGTPGIGKSYGVGSFLLHSLLHFNDGMLDVVAYFVGKIAYLIYNKKPGEEGRVERYKVPEDAVDAIAALVSKKKKGHIIVDIGNDLLKPPGELRHLSWGVTVLTSPDTAHYEEWAKDTGGRRIIINCDDVRDMKAFVAWKKLCVLSEEVPRDKTRQQLKEELESEWKIVEERIDMVGPLPRFVFSAPDYDERLESVRKEARQLDAQNGTKYDKIISKSKGWQNDKVTHKLVKIVRVSSGTVNVDSYRCRSLSVNIWNMLICTLFGILIGEMTSKEITLSDECVGANAFERLALLSLLFPRVFKVIANNLKYLRRGREIADRRSILNDMAPQQLRLIGQKALPAADQRPIDNCEYMVLYLPATGNEPVVDGFFFVEGRLRRNRDGTAPQTTPNIAVLLQVTKSERHPTATDKVKKFRENMARYFSDWGAFSRNMVWEMIYINSVNGGTITRRQLCEGPPDRARGGGRGPLGPQTFWESIDQFQVTLKETMQAELIQAYRRESGMRDAPALMGLAGRRRAREEVVEGRGDVAMRRRGRR